MDAPFHPGAVSLQRLAGVDRRLDTVGRTVIRDHMPDQHRELFGKLPTLFLGAVDPAGQPWATVITGPPGFMHTPDARTLSVNALPAMDDPVAPLLQPGASVGLLGLEPHTRRRNRMNGRVDHADAGRLVVQVQQSFGNCPKYIQARKPTPLDRPPGPSQALGPAGWPEAARDLVTRSDMLFIASASGPRPGPSPAEGVDVSHRGGLPGFVGLHEDNGRTVLTLPDYPGNLFFNTLGNLVVWPRAGLLFIDPDSGDMLQLAVQTRLVQSADALASYPGAQRLVTAQVVGGWWRPGALPLRWSAAELSPHLANMAPGDSGKPARS
jgi:uncharacterized protein